MDAVDEIKARLSIEDVIGGYIQLKHAGRNWKGISPFTNEKTPSFIVSPEKQIWHDFSSGKGGDMFSFVMEVEGLDFKSALELLARRAGVDLEQYRRDTRGNGPNKTRLRDLLELSVKFYQLHFSKHRPALEYVLQKRKFSKATALTWRLGYSPAGGNALIDFLKSKGFSELEMKQAGVSSRRYSGIGDMFRGRLMIPLQDPFGEVIGFTARLLVEDPSAPKYINTPQTVLYDKSRHVFGLHLAKEAIRKDQYVVVTEGNLDVIASHQAGSSQVVAVAGTALTEQHLKILSRQVKDIRLCFDADRAGLAATERAIPIASQVGVSLSIIDIPAGKDPDELIQDNPKLWQKVITEHTYALDWLMELYKKELNIESAPGKRQFTDRLLPLVNRLSDSVEQDHYMTSIAAAIGINREALTKKLATFPADKKIRKQQKMPSIKLDLEQIEYSKLQDHFLALMLIQPKLRDHLAFISPEMLSKPEAKQLLSSLLASQKLNNSAKDQLQQIDDYVKILTLEYEELYQDIESSELEYEATRLQIRLVEAYVKHQKQKLAVELESTSEARTGLLLKKVKQLDALLKSVTGGI
ncbi:MAG: DNA primase [Candidatus Saccharimonadales bacterium]